MNRNFIEEDMHAENIKAMKPQSSPSGPIAELSTNYNDSSNRLLGFALSMSYEEVQFTTCDPWKRNCGGVARNQFIIIKISKKLVNPEDHPYCDRLILGRITESVPTPVEREIQGTVFQIHKLQPIVDPITQKELQWSALKATILGTFYDNENGEICFGNDVDTFFTPLAYEVYVPTDEDLELLINSFIHKKDSFEIGYLRYTETPSPFGQTSKVPVKVSVEDFVGKNYGHRTALFGKTRFGKSNTIKVIADTILRSSKPPGQIIFDPSGEYTYFNPQDNTSLYMLHRGKCVRYSMDPDRTLPHEEKRAGLDSPKPLFVNFYRDIAVGHSLICQLFNVEFPNRLPNYMIPILDWTPPATYPSLPQEPDEYWRFWRSVSLWWGCLKLAGYQEPQNLAAKINFKHGVKKELEKTCAGLYKVNNDISKSLTIPVDNLPTILKEVAKLYFSKNKTDTDLFKTSDGKPYFNAAETEMLKILLDDGKVSGKIYLTPFKKFHSPKGTNIFNEIVNHAENGKTVFIDFARSNSTIREFLSERICKSLLDKMMDRFSNGTLQNRFVILYFEEAHKLFPKGDEDLNNVYNTIAKEGAKFHISMIYATQSMTTLSPDLLKNTENFIIGHLDDDREVREVTRKRAFRDMAEDVERIQSKGYVRMLTVSHKFALPVQIRKFEAINKQLSLF